jgi:tetratricopeptide (TPR) repeat protein
MPGPRSVFVIVAPPRGPVILVQIENALQYPAMVRDVLRSVRSLAVLMTLLMPARAALAQGFGGTVADHLVRGDSLLAQGKASEAIMQFQEARTLCPTPAEIVSALQGEAQGHLMQEEPLPAVGLLEEAATRFPDDPRASNLLYQAAFAAQRAGEIDKAIELYRHALDHKPTQDIVPPLKFRLALALRLRGRAGEVIDLLKDFEKDHPDHPLLPNVLYTIAIADHDLGSGNRAKLEESASIYKKLIDRYPDRPAAIESHFEMGLVLDELGRNAEAVDYFTKYVTMNPASPEAATALERAADLMLLRAPKRSAELYALAKIKAKVNPKPTDPAFALSRWLTIKRALADVLSRVWVLAVLAVVVLGVFVLLGWLIVKRFRKAPVPASA